MKRRAIVSAGGAVVAILLVLSWNPSNQVTPVSSSKMASRARESKVEGKKIGKIRIKPSKDKIDFPKAQPRLSSGEMERIKQLRKSSRSQLAFAYTALKAVGAELGRYTTDLRGAFGAGPYIENMNYNYKFGFLEPYEPEKYFDYDHISEEPGFLSTDSFVDGAAKIGNQTYRYSSKEIASIELKKYSKLCQLGCTAGKDFFEIMLVAPLPSGGVDVWVVNHEKEIRLVQNGLMSLQAGD